MAAAKRATTTIRLTPREQRAILGYRTMRDNSDRALVDRLIAGLQPAKYAERQGRRKATRKGGA